MNQPTGSIEVRGRVATKIRGQTRKRIKTERWYARIVVFQADQRVPDEPSLDVSGYEEDEIGVLITWFYPAKDIRHYLSGQPKSDTVDHIKAALHSSQYLAGTQEDTISWTTVISAVDLLFSRISAHPHEQEWLRRSTSQGCAASGLRTSFGIDGPISWDQRRV